MATAKRVKQEDKVETVPVPSTTRTFMVAYTDGVEMRRTLMGDITNTFIKTQRTPQPDHIVLEMSIEEATAFERIVGDLRSGDALDGPYDAVADALEMSPNAGTQTPPAKDAASCAGSLLQPDAYYKQTILNSYR